VKEGEYNPSTLTYTFPAQQTETTKLMRYLRSHGPNLWPEEAMKREYEKAKSGRRMVEELEAKIKELEEKEDEDMSDHNCNNIYKVLVINRGNKEIVKEVTVVAGSETEAVVRAGVTREQSEGRVPEDLKVRILVLGSVDLEG